MTNSRNKGANFERLVARILRAVWPESKRGIGQARCAKECADVEGTPFWVECKRYKRCNIQKAVEQAIRDTDGRPVLIITKDDKKTELVTMKLTTFLEMFTCPAPEKTALTTSGSTKRTTRSVPTVVQGFRVDDANT